ncbi:integrase core domain-containing protein [uncultured Aliiroseovarius sp.]|uniref:integrase core domain-containing protein n=1 Tax=Aliiroseovarius sediminis TaxID=2925839 RepID=UPI00338EFF3B
MSFAPPASIGVSTQRAPVPVDGFSAAGHDLERQIGAFVDFYNHNRPHSALGGKPPAVIYWQRNETTNPDQQVQRVA